MSQALSLLPQTSLAGGLSGFAALVQQANQYPLLTAEEEQKLTLRYRRENDLQAAQRLVLSHLRFVVKITREFGGYGLPAEDLAQEGTIGLMKAVKRFDPERGVRLASFALHWIRAEIYEYVIRNWRIVKVATTKAQRKLFFKLRQAKKSLGWLNEKQLIEVADELKVRPEDVSEMERRLSAHDAIFEASQEEGDDRPTLAPEEYLQDQRFEPSRTLERQESESDKIEALQHALAQLKPRSQEIIRRRWMQEPKATLDELAQEYAISIERVRQIERDAMRKMARLLEPTRQ